MTDVGKRSLLCVLGGMLALGGVAATQQAGATHVVPKGAAPLRVPLVVAYKKCTNPDDTHRAPLAFPSCRFPARTSSYVTVGTPDANGAEANGSGFLRLGVKTTPPEEVLIKAEITDVRCTPATNASVCNNANSMDGPDYSGDLEFNMTVRITDHYNGPNQDQPATVQDIPFLASAPCVNTQDNLVGGFCSTAFSPQPLIPNQDLDGHRTVVEIEQARLYDGGADGSVPTNDNTLFMTQGLFVP